MNSIIFRLRHQEKASVETMERSSLKSSDNNLLEEPATIIKMNSNFYSTWYSSIKVNMDDIIEYLNSIGVT